MLGDELYYSTNEKNPIYWKLLDEIEESHELPNSCEPLSNYVKGSDALKRRLNQTGIINKEDGMKLISRLKYGQRLVSKEGDLWRWDGLVVTSTSSSSASERLQNRNQLEDTIKSIDEFEKKIYWNR